MKNYLHFNIFEKSPEAMSGGSVPGPNGDGVYEVPASRFAAGDPNAAEFGLVKSGDKFEGAAKKNEEGVEAGTPEPEVEVLDFEVLGPETDRQLEMQQEQQRGGRLSEPESVMVMGENPPMDVAREQLRQLLNPEAEPRQELARSNPDGSVDQTAEKLELARRERIERISSAEHALMVEQLLGEYDQEMLALAEAGGNGAGINLEALQAEMEEDPEAKPELKAKKYIGWVYRVEQEKSGSLFGGLFRAIKHALDFRLGSALSETFKWLFTGGIQMNYRMRRHAVVYEVMERDMPKELKGQLEEYAGPFEAGSVIAEESAESEEKDYPAMLMEYLKTEGPRMSSEQLEQASSLLTAIGYQGQLELLNGGDDSLVKLYFEGQQALQESNSGYRVNGAELIEMRQTMENGLLVLEADFAGKADPAFQDAATEQGLNINREIGMRRGALAGVASLEATNLLMEKSAGAGEAVAEGAGAAVEGASGIAGTLTETAASTAEGATEAVNGIAETAGSLTETAGEAAKAVGEAAGGIVKGALGAVKGAAGAIGDAATGGK